MASHKTLKSVVRNFAESFASLSNHRGDDYVMGHLVYAAWETKGTTCRVDLLTGTIDPSPLLVPPVRESIASHVQWFPVLVQGSNSDLSFIASAGMVITIDPNTRRFITGTLFRESPYTCTVQITDDRGKLYAHRISDWWYPEKV
ncbi:MAG: hypothetical protein IIC20_01755 [Chloroflexi bacterium]|nr:hypothetical protein [Chloroflexota bacterium]